MSLQVTRETFQKLTHDSPEIRLRTLEQLTGKIERALKHNLTIIFKPVELCKQLIRWFGMKPLQVPEDVLRLLLQILRSSYGEQIMEQLTVKRLRREMCKVQMLLKGHEKELALVEEVHQLLREQQRREEIDDIIELTDTLSINATEESAQTVGDCKEVCNAVVAYAAKEYEVAWSKPTVADFNSMKFIADTLGKDEATSVELQNTLQHFQIIVEDYPAEYMLQAPYIYVNLLHLYERSDELKCPLENIGGAFLVFLKMLKTRLLVRQKSLSYATPAKDLQLLGKTQLKVEVALQRLLEQCFSQLEMRILEFCNETTQILEIILEVLSIYKLLQLHPDRTCLIQLAKIAEKLRESIEQGEHFALQRIKHLLIIFLLQDVAENGGIRKQQLLEIEILEPLLRDYSLEICFPQLVQSLKQFLFNADPALQQKYSTLRKYERSFGTALMLLKTPKCMKSSEVIVNGATIYLSIDRLHSVQLVEQLFEAITDCNHLYLSNSALKTEASDLLMRLLQLRHEPLRVYAYHKLSQVIKKHFACLMNGESYNANVANAKLLADQIIGVPLSSTLLVQIVNDSYESTIEHVKQSCEDIIVVLLKSQHLLGENWVSFLEVLQPVLPLLQGCSFSKKVLELLLKLFDPDAKMLPFIAMLQGNIAFLFDSSEQVRNEALTRVIYILSSLPKAQEFLPNIMEVSDVIPNDLCQLQVPRDLSHIFASSDSFNELATLHNLLDLLDSPDIEPLIRKSTFMQINVMCQNWKMAVAFCQEQAHFFVLQALENSLREDTSADYNETAKPAIGILSKVLFHDVDLRQELSATPNIFALLLRALCLFESDLQVRQDASVCLFLLIFNSFLVLPGNSVEVPRILGNLNLPLKCVLKSANVAYCSDALTEIFAAVQEEEKYLRQLVAVSFAGGYAKINKKCLEDMRQYDVSSKLHLTPRDWRLMKATVPTQNLKRLLHAMSNATEHKSLTNAVISLKLQLLLSYFGTPVPEELAVDIFKMLNKYLQLPPGNESDFLLFEHLLELCDLCARLQLRPIVEGMMQSLQADQDHAVIMLLKNSGLPLRLYYKLSQLLLHLIDSSEKLGFKVTGSASSGFRRDLFEAYFEIVTKLYDQRDLQRARCILRLLQLLSSSPLYMPDDILLYYCKRLISLSIALKSFSQTGAQWQRDCFLIVCQLQPQMEQPQQTFKFKGSVLKYLSGMCGHNDAQVRALAWCILGQVARYKFDGVSGAETLISELSYLPGGLLACCLSTLLDTAEMMMVRQLAGHLFVEILSETFNAEQAHQLLKQHTFLRLAKESLSSCVIDEMLPTSVDRDSSGDFITCEIVSCYCRISIEVFERQSSFVNELCESGFLFKLYELLKMPPAHGNDAYYVMCSDICQLYAMCYKNNFVFLQRTLCRDQVWLTRFCQLLDQPDAQECVLVNILQLQLALCMDTTAYNQLCDKIAKTPECIVKLFQRAFNLAHFNSPLQRCALAVLSMLLIKSQTQLEARGELNSFIAMLESPLEMLQMQTSEKDADKENIRIENSQMLSTQSTKNKSLEAIKQLSSFDKSSHSAEAAAANTNVPASLIFIKLYRIFTHLYPTRSCKFHTAPNGAKVQIAETLALLLKFSPHAQEAATNLKFLSKIVSIFKAFFEEFNTTCVTFVRRHGETKKLAIINNFLLLFNILHYWYSSPTALLADELQAAELTKVFIQIWPWLAQSFDLKVRVLQVCAFLSEHSLIVCQQFSALISSYANSILQLVIKIVVFETNTVKALSSNTFPIITTGLRVIMNCCACVEGRVSVLKAHTLDVFDCLHPFNAKSPKIKFEILQAWLEFWELISRYSEGAQARNLNALCELINRSPPGSATRLLSLKILRNMCFLNGNRSPLMASTDFIYTINHIITQPVDTDASNASYEEQMHVSVAVWKLISGGVKIVGLIRGTKLAKKFRMLREQLSTLEEEDSARLEQLPFAVELANVLEVIQRIMSD